MPFLSLSLCLSVYVTICFVRFFASDFFSAFDFLKIVKRSNYKIIYSPRRSSVDAWTKKSQLNPNPGLREGGTERTDESVLLGFFCPALEEGRFGLLTRRGKKWSSSRATPWVGPVGHTQVEKWNGIKSAFGVRRRTLPGMKPVDPNTENRRLAYCLQLEFILRIKNAQNLAKDYKVWRKFNKFITKWTLFTMKFINISNFSSRL